MKKMYFIACIGLLLAACGKVDIKPGPPGDAGPQGPAAVRPTDDTATIFGNVSLYNELTYNWPHFDSIRVTLQWGKDTLNTQTDTAGNYAFHHMETGTYNLTFERAGFGTMKVYGITHTGGGKLNTRVQPVMMMQKAVRTKPRGLQFPGIDTSRGMSRVLLSWMVDTAGSLIPIDFSRVSFFDVYVSNKPHPGPDNFLAYTSSVGSPDYYISYNAAFSTASLNGQLQIGDSIYFSIITFPRNVYSEVPNTPGYGTWSPLPLPQMSYIDPKNGQTVYPFKGDPVYFSAIYRYRAQTRTSVTLQPHD